ncbi:MAG: alpha/beta hydrolase [Sphingomicrobium sp.]
MLQKVRMSKLFIALVALCLAGPVIGRQAPLAPGVHTVAAADGLKLWYKVAGKAKGVPLIFLHGGPGEGSQVFQSVGGPQLEKTQRLIYFDQRGSGRSERRKDASIYTLDIMVADIEALRRHLGVPRISLLGHSFGTLLALEYAARFPNHVSRMVLAGAVSDFPGQTDLLCERLSHLDPEAFVRAKAGLRPGSERKCDLFAGFSGRGSALQNFVNRNMFPELETEQLVKKLDNANGLQNDGAVGGALMSKGLFDYRFAGVSRVTAPVLIIAGGKDYQLPSALQRDLARKLPSARFVEYPANGHFMFAENPIRFAHDVTEFLAKAK